MGEVCAWERRLNGLAEERDRSYNPRETSASTKDGLFKRPFNFGSKILSWRVLQVALCRFNF